MHLCFHSREALVLEEELVGVPFFSPTFRLLPPTPWYVHGATTSHLRKPSNLTHLPLAHTSPLSVSTPCDSADRPLYFLPVFQLGPARSGSPIHICLLVQESPGPLWRGADRLGNCFSLQITPFQDSPFLHSQYTTGVLSILWPQRACRM